MGRGGSDWGRMLEKFRTWLKARSYVTQSLVFGLAWALMWFVVQLTIPTHRTSARSVVGYLAGSLIGGLVFGFILVAFVRRKAKTPAWQVNAAAEKAIKAGVLPGDADPEVWIPSLKRKLRDDRLSVWVGPIVFGLFALLGIYLLITDPGSWLPWAYLLIFLGFGIWIPVVAVRRRPKVETLLAELEIRRRSGPVEAPGM